MIKLITGKKGTGKTKILVDMINNAVKDTNGDLICIEKGAKPVIMRSEEKCIKCGMCIASCKFGAVEKK